MKLIKKLVNFARIRQKETSLQRRKTSVLNSAPDWQMKVVIGMAVKIPKANNTDIATSGQDYLFG